MLNNEFYIGTLVVGKYKSRSINGKQIPVPDEERIKHPNAHEPIIDKATFQLVQEIIKERSGGNYRGKKIQTRDNIFAGLLYCADCGTRMTSSNGGNNTRYICRSYNVYGTSVCSSHSAMESALTETVLEFLEHCRDNLMHVLLDIDKIINAELSNKTDNKCEIQELLDRLEKAQQAIKTLVEQKIYETMKNPEMSDIINKTYNDIQNEKYQEIKSLERQIADIQNIEIEEVNIRKNLNFSISVINNALNSQKLTKKQVLTLIDRINVHEDGGLDIFLKGNLHELCTNYFKMGDTKIRKIKSLLYEFILQDTQKIITRNAAFYMRENGIKLTFESLSKIVKEELLNAGLIAKNPMNRGYRLIADISEIERVLIGNNVVDYTRWLCHNCDIFGILNSINEWVARVEYEGQKNLF